nr:MAG TPA: hypothetical protein [Caudoviricetes sp.]
MPHSNPQEVQRPRPLKHSKNYIGSWGIVIGQLRPLRTSLE